MKSIALTALLFIHSISLYAASIDDLRKLQAAYPKQIKSVNDDYITWRDGTNMPVMDNQPYKTREQKLIHPSLSDQIVQVQYPTGKTGYDHAAQIKTDPGRIRYEPFFAKMYGATQKQVEAKLTAFYWMEQTFGQRYLLRATTVNGIDIKIKAISHELDQLVAAHPDYRQYLDDPGGMYKWRHIAETHRLSPHSYGMAIDINPKQTQYWQWDLKQAHLPITETTPLTYHNKLPWEIVDIFEKHGFIWGGKWYHYDTMHFEYRPELLMNNQQIAIFLPFYDKTLVETLIPLGISTGGVI